MSLNIKRKLLLTVDAVINLLLGVVLLLFPVGIIELLGLPPVAHHFYTTILGAVIVGIGIALLIEIFGASHDVRGLGLAGAIVINFCGSGALLIWLVFRPFELPPRGDVILWSVAVLVLCVGLIELITGSWKTK
jgi:hypothetical protein